MPTDTIYGVVATALQPQAVERIYSVKKRPRNKRLIFLVSDYDQLKILGINVNNKQQDALRSVWPGPVSVDLACDPELEYIHNGYGSIAVRMPQPSWLQDFVSRTGPLATSSANLSDQPYDGDLTVIRQSLPDLDFYLEGPTQGTPSRLAKLTVNGDIHWLARS